MHCMYICIIYLFMYVQYVLVLSCSGTCGEVEDGAPMMILELMPYGDLKSFLSKQK